MVKHLTNMNNSNGSPFGLLTAIGRPIRECSCIWVLMGLCTLSAYFCHLLSMSWDILPLKHSYSLCHLMQQLVLWYFSSLFILVESIFLTSRLFWLDLQQIELVDEEFSTLPLH